MATKKPQKSLLDLLVKSVSLVKTKDGLKLVIRPDPRLTRLSINLKDKDK